jgi:hypothetical protein
MVNTPKIDEKIRAFFEAFNGLSGEEKVYFIVELEKEFRKNGSKDKKIHLELIKAAKEGLTCDEAVINLKKAQYGI